MAVQDIAMKRLKRERKALNFLFSTTTDTENFNEAGKMDLAMRSGQPPQSHRHDKCGIFRAGWMPALVNKKN